MSAPQGYSLRSRQETIVQTESAAGSSPSRRVVLQLRNPEPRVRREVQWTTDTVDNEHMGKKKSKCCCVYSKPKKFGESDDSESEKECDSCSGHVERKKKKRSSADGSGSASTNDNNANPPAHQHDHTR